MGNKIKFSEDWRLIETKNGVGIEIGSKIVQLDKYDNPYIAYKQIQESGNVNPNTTLSPKTLTKKLNSKCNAANKSL